MFGEQRTKTVELYRGYVDPDGNAHRKVTLRVPMIEDEIRRDAAVAELRRSSASADRDAATSEALHTLALVKEVIVSWEGIVQIQLMHLRSLTRLDAAKLIDTFYALEAEDAAEAKKIIDEGPEGNDDSE